MAFDRREDERRKGERRKGDRRREDRRSRARLLASGQRAEMLGPPTQEEVDHILGSLEYETWMLRQTADWLEAHRDQVGQPAANAHLESYLLHAKNLTEFFFPTDPASYDYTLASDFVPDWSSHAVLMDELAELRDVARRHLSRLSFAASDYPRPHLIQEASRNLELLREAFEDLLRGVGL